MEQWRRRRTWGEESESRESRQGISPSDYCAEVMVVVMVGKHGGRASREFGVGGS